MITIYSKPGCHKCKLTKDMIKRKGLDFNEIDITQDEDAAALLASMGVMVLPYVVTDRDSWSDFRIDKLRGLTK
jgi:glutaredoxin-like protein NrdH